MFGKVKKKSLELSAFLTALLLAQTARAENPFDYGIIENPIKQGVEAGHSLIKGIAKGVLGMLLLGAGLGLTYIIVGHLIGSYQRKKEMGQVGPFTAVGYVATGVIAISLTFVAFYFAYAGITKLVNRF